MRDYKPPPLPEDLGFIGRLRKCKRCGKTSTMYWIPSTWWNILTNEDERDGHICFSCLIEKDYLNALEQRYGL